MAHDYIAQLEADVKTLLDTCEKFYNEEKYPGEYKIITHYVDCFDCDGTGIKYGMFRAHTCNKCNGTGKILKTEEVWDGPVDVDSHGEMIERLREESLKEYTTALKRLEDIKYLNSVIDNSDHISDKDIIKKIVFKLM